MYHIISNIPYNNQKDFWGGSLIITHLFVGIMDDFLEKVVVRVFWYDLDSVEIWDCNKSKMIKILFTNDIFDLDLLENPEYLPCDF